MEVRRDVRAVWVSPVLVRKPLEETRAGTGVKNDGVFEMQS
jgi:hypothetical protein